MGVPDPLKPRRFCSAIETDAPFDADGVWLPLVVEAVSAALRFLLVLEEMPFVGALPCVVDEAGFVDG